MWTLIGLVSGFIACLVIVAAVESWANNRGTPMHPLSPAAAWTLLFATLVFGALFIGGMHLDHLAALQSVQAKP